jgi:uncharacterized protein
MNLWAISDLHLAFATPKKTMDIFGLEWKNHAQKIEENWKRVVSDEDLVLIPGDISWAMTIEEASKDLLWIHNLPGTKLLLKGNHDYWWSSLKKVREALPPSLHVLQNDSFHWKHFAIGGSRLWDSLEYSFCECIEFRENPSAKKEEEIQKELSSKIFERELFRLEQSLKTLPNTCSHRIAMTHFPPIGADLKPSKASCILKNFGIETCVFGHLHSLKKGVSLFGEKEGITYRLVSCDFLNFEMAKIF